MAGHSEKGETPMMEAKAHKRGFLKKAETLSAKMKNHAGKGKQHLSSARKGGK